MRVLSFLLILFCLLACQSEESKSDLPVLPAALQGKTMLLHQNDGFNYTSTFDKQGLSFDLDSIVKAKQETITAEILEELFPKIEVAEDLMQKYQEIFDARVGNPNDSLLIPIKEKMYTLLNQKMVDFILANPQIPHYNLLQYKENYQIRTSDTLYIGSRFIDNSSFSFKKNIEVGQQGKLLVIYAGDVENPVRGISLYCIALGIPLSELKPFDEYTIEIFSRDLGTTFILK